MSEMCVRLAENTGHKNDDLRNIPCILEVDLRYRDEFHDLHMMTILFHPCMLKSIVIKLIPNLNYKEKYVLPSAILKLYESLGLEIGKVHRGLRFEL